MKISKKTAETEQARVASGYESENPERAASLVEYALLIALISLVCVAAITVLGNATSNKFSSMATGLQNTAS